MKPTYSHEALVVLGLAPRSVAVQMLNIRRSNSWTLMQAAKFCLIFISWDIRSHGSNWMTLNKIHVNPGHDPGMERPWQSNGEHWTYHNISTIWLSWFLSQALVLEVWLTLNPESQSPISSGVEFRRRLWVACNGMCRGTIQSTSVSAEDQMKKLLMGSVGAVQGHVNEMYDLWQRPFFLQKHQP